MLIYKTQALGGSDKEVHAKKVNGLTERINNTIIHTKEDVQA